MLRKGMIRMRMHKSKDYRCLTSEQKKQKISEIKTGLNDAECLVHHLHMREISLMKT